jgi:hypothetical protein
MPSAKFTCKYSYSFYIIQVWFRVRLLYALSRAKSHEMSFFQNLKVPRFDELSESVPEQSGSREQKPSDAKGPHINLS